MIYAMLMISYLMAIKKERTELAKGGMPFPQKGAFMENKHIGGDLNTWIYLDNIFCFCKPRQGKICSLCQKGALPSPIYPKRGWQPLLPTPLRFAFGQSG